MGGKSDHCWFFLLLFLFYVYKQPVGLCWCPCSLVLLVCALLLVHNTSGLLCLSMLARLWLYVYLLLSTRLLMPTTPFGDQMPPGVCTFDICNLLSCKPITSSVPTFSAFSNNPVSDNPNWIRVIRTSLSNFTYTTIHQVHLIFFTARLTRSVNDGWKTAAVLILSTRSVFSTADLLNGE